MNICNGKEKELGAHCFPSPAYCLHSLLAGQARSGQQIPVWIAHTSELSTGSLCCLFLQCHLGVCSWLWPWKRKWVSTALILRLILSNKRRTSAMIVAAARMAGWRGQMWDARCPFVHFPLPPPSPPLEVATLASLMARLVIPV